MMIDYERIKKDCFWDISMSKSNIDDILLQDKPQQKAFLYQKILLNSTQLFKDISIFSIEDISKLTEDFKVPRFNHDYIFRRKNLVEVYFLDKPLLIDELKWVA